MTQYDTHIDMTHTASFLDGEKMKVKEWSQFRVRLPRELHDKIKNNAKAAYRSLNSEVLMILEKYSAETEKASGPAVGSKPDASITNE